MPDSGGGARKVVSDTAKALAVFVYANKIYLISRSAADPADSYRLSQSDDGFNFELSSKEGHFRSSGDKLLDLTKIQDLRISKVDQNLIAVFIHKNRTTRTHLAKFSSLLEWSVLDPPKGIPGTGAILPNKTQDGEYVFLGGKDEIKIAFSQNLTDWEISDSPIIDSRPDKFDSGSLSVESATLTHSGILVLYQSTVNKNPVVGAAIFDRSNPDVLLWRTNDYLWKPIPQWASKKLTFVGTIERLEKIISYWQVEGEGIYAVTYLLGQNDITVQSKNISLFLNKTKTNPLISPRSENGWEAFTTFNPAAIYEDGKVHILYRAQGYDYVSVVGYANSDDGLTINERHDEPCYIPKEKFEESNGPAVVELMSGGGFGGCEDPRLTKIGDKIYMTYVAFNGYSEPRIALTSISVTDFLNHRWFWEKPVLISPPGIIDKSAVIFPETINGKYVILHRVFPDILLDFVDSLEFDGGTWLKGEYRIKIRPDHWDSRKIGAGAPPIKTKDGWLLIYYSVDERDAGRYKIGAMLLDLTDPRKVLYRTNNPILEPNERYENEGFKAGVAYPCGAVVIGETLFVYYGGADTVVCVATARLADFISDLKHSHLAKLEPALIRKIK